MTKVKFRVKDIQINLPEWKVNKEGNINNNLLYKLHTLPLKIAYNKSWIFRFECGACHEVIKFDKTTQRSGKTIDCLFEPYYSKETLINIASLFENMKVFSNIEEPDKLFLTHHSYKDINAATLFIPKISLQHNICPSCNTPILYWINDEHPRTPSREYHTGGAGHLQLFEIVGLNENVNDSLTNFAWSYS